VRKFIVIAVAIALLSGGVAWKVMVARADRMSPEVGSGNVVRPGEYQPSEDEVSWIGARTGTAGVFIKKFGEYRFVLIAAGEKPTGGYSVEIVKAAASGGDWVVDVRFVAPKPGDMVIQIITYPYGFVKIKDDGKGLKVRDVTGSQPVELAVTGE